jgi:CheY-like chemotaxis protein
VLVIEDNQDAREMFRMMLELAGHEVLEAGDGLTGLEILKAQRPDVAVIDVGLPGLNGYEIARRFREEPDSDDVTLVALTGYGTPDARERSRQAGFDHHLIKPVNAEALQRILRAERFSARVSRSQRAAAVVAGAGGAPAAAGARHGGKSFLA